MMNTASIHEGERTGSFERGAHVTAFNQLTERRSRYAITARYLCRRFGVGSCRHAPIAWRRLHGHRMVGAAVDDSLYRERC